MKTRKDEAGIGFVPEDRQHTGLVLDYPVATNFILRDYDLQPASHHGLLDFKYMARNAAELVKRYDVRLRSPQQPARFLSGGNQQKVILAREIEAKPKILVIMQACKGLDVGAIEFVQNTIFELKTWALASSISRQSSSMCSTLQTASASCTAAGSRARCCRTRQPPNGLVN